MKLLPDKTENFMSRIAITLFYLFLLTVYCSMLYDFFFYPEFHRLIGGEGPTGEFWAYKSTVNYFMWTITPIVWLLAGFVLMKKPVFRRLFRVHFIVTAFWIFITALPELLDLIFGDNA